MWKIYKLFIYIHIMPKFILQQIFNDLIGGKLDLSQRIKTKQAFIVFDWKDTSVEEEEGKIIATRFIISYL